MHMEGAVHSQVRREEITQSGIPVIVNVVITIIMQVTAKKTFYFKPAHFYGSSQTTSQPPAVIGSTVMLISFPMSFRVENRIVIYGIQASFDVAHGIKPILIACVQSCFKHAFMASIDTSSPDARKSPQIVSFPRPHIFCSISPSNTCR